MGLALTGGPSLSPDDIGPPLDLAVQALDGIRAVQLRPVLLGKGHAGEDALLGPVHEGRELGQLRAHLVRDLAPLRLGRRVLGWAKAVAMKAETTRRLLLPAWAKALRWKWTRQRCQVVDSTRAVAALFP